MTKKVIIAVSIILSTLSMFLLVACQSDATVAVSDDIELQIQPTDSPGPGLPTLETYVFATSQDGYITLHGMLAVLDPTTMLPGPDDAIFLVPMDSEGEGVTGIPQFTVGEVPQADVDESTGEFVFVDIEPGKYAVVAMTKGGTQIPTRKMEDGSYSIFSFSADRQNQTVELGELSLP